MAARSAVHLIVAILLAVVTASPGRQRNLVRNGDFQEIEASRPTGWFAYGNTQHVDQTLDVVREGGSYVARLQCRSIHGQGGDIHAMIGQVGTVRLTAGRLYELTCRAREEGIAGRTVSVAVTDTSSWENCGLARDLPLGPNWQTYHVLFRATRSVGRSSRLQFWFAETGTLYLADVRLEEVPVQKVSFTHVVPASAARNLLPNGAFNLGTWGWTTDGIPAGWGHMAHLYGRIIVSRDPVHPQFLRIPMGHGITPILYFDYFHPAAVVQTRLLAANLGWIPVVPGKPYVLSCDVRASVAGTPVLLGYVGSDPARGPWDRVSSSTHVSAELRWHRYTYRFIPSRPYVFVEIGPDLREDERTDVDIARVQLEAGTEATPYTPHNAVEGALQPEAPAGVYRFGLKNAVRLVVHNNTAVRTRIPVTIQAEDFFGRRTTLAQVAIQVAANAGCAKEILIPAGWTGYFRLSALGPWGKRDLRIAVLPKSAVRSTIFGFNHAFADAFLIRLARKAGISWYRDWSLKWNDVEPQPGHYDFSQPDEQLERLGREGCSVVCLLPPFPSADWNSEAPPNVGGAGYPAERARAAYAPRDPRLLAEFVRRTVRHFAPHVRVWEFLNEPVYTDYALPARAARGGGKPYTVQDYAHLLEIAAAAMREADPGCTVIGGVASGPKHLTREEMDAGVGRIVDVLNLHIYPGTRLPEGTLPEMRDLAHLMAQHGGRKPIWITEFGYYAADDPGRTPWIPDAANFPETSLLKDERECAEYTVRFAAIMLASGVKKIFIHAGSSGPPNQPSLECPLFDEAGAPRKVLPALAAFNAHITPEMNAGPVRRFGRDGYGVQFASRDRAVFLLWSAGQPIKIPPPPASARVYDIMGRNLQMLEYLQTSPAYVEGSRRLVERWAEGWMARPGRS
ncbi:MAG: beta-galactosidase [Chthonomonadales bacterium]